MNIESVNKAKSECLSKLLLDNNVDIAVIQETHTREENDFISKIGD